jgi:nucleoside triphosphate diphosphatase
MSKLDELLAIMARLRDPEKGCPWDREQTFASIVPYTIEEAYEVAETIEQGTLQDLPDELGDLLFQVVFFAQMAREAGRFDFEDVVAGVVEKMIRRHPHVFGDARIDSAAAQSLAWERHKAHERRAKAAGGERHPSLLDGIGLAMPALTRAVKLQKRAARAGFDWPAIGPVLAKLREETEELQAEMTQGSETMRVADEIGDLLFTCANLARHAGIDPEGALRRANAKFERRFRRMEAFLAVEGRKAEEVSLDELDGLWERAKSEEIL